MSKSPTSHGMSDGARAVLDEYTFELARRVLDEAERLNPDDRLTARDISDAIAHVSDSPMSESASFGLARSARSTRLTLVYSTTATIIGLMATLTGVVGQTTIRSDALGWVMVGLAYLSTIIVGSVAMTNWLQVRRARSRAVQLAESGSPNSALAAWVAEAVQSSRNNTTSDLDGTVRIVQFLSKWSRLEERIRRLAHLALKMPADITMDYPIGPLVSQLSHSEVIGPLLEADLREVISVRNKLAHGDSASNVDIAGAMRSVDTLDGFLDNYITVHTPEDIDERFFPRPSRQPYDGSVG